MIHPNVYLTRETEFCSLCLRLPEQSPLTKCFIDQTNEYSGLLGVAPSSPWLCGWCAVSVRSFLRLRGRAQRASVWLDNVFKAGFGLNGTEELLMAELASIQDLNMSSKTSPVVVVQGRPSERTDNVRDYGEMRSEEASVKREINSDDEPLIRSSQTVQVKIECDADDTYEDGDAFNRAHYAQCADGDPLDGFAGGITPDGDVRSQTQRAGTSNQTDQYAESGMKSEGSPPGSPGRRGAGGDVSPQLFTAFQQIMWTPPEETAVASSYDFTKTDVEMRVPLDEYDDVEAMVAGVMEEQIEPYLLTEKKFKERQESRLNSAYFKRQRYSCQRCVLSFTNGDSLEEHGAQHDPSRGPFACRLCDTRAASEDDLAAHVTSHLRRYGCSRCGATSQDRRELLDHYFARHTRVSFHCKRCGVRIKGPYYIKTHIENMHMENRPKKTRRGRKARLKKLEAAGEAEEMTKTPFRCAQCDKTFSTRTCLKRHVKGVHENTLPRVACPVCAKLVRACALSAHARSHETPERVPCPQCGNTCKNQRALQMHIYRLHRTDEDAHNLVPCDVCQKEVRPCNMSSHMRSHRDPSLACAFCRQTAHSRRALAEHVAGHTRGDVGGRFQCNDCGKAFPHRANITDHIRLQHTRIACKLCDEEQENVRFHREHMKRHHGVERERRHVCDLCGKGFTRARVLIQHRRTHTGEKPHGCTECGARFMQHAALWTHVRRKHARAEEPFAGGSASFAGGSASFAGGSVPFGGGNVPFGEGNASFGENASFAGGNAPFAGGNAAYAGVFPPFGGVGAPYAGVYAPAYQR